MLDNTGLKVAGANIGDERNRRSLSGHNHHVEFQPMDGELPWDTFFSNTSPTVIMQFGRDR
jgi:hypothetical protein